MVQLTGRRDLLLLLIGDDPHGLGGITRLQKYLFLLQNEEHLELPNARFEFEPYKAGPYSPQLYDDLEFLENLGFIESEVTAEASLPEAAEIDQLSFGHLMNTERVEAETADTFEEKRFRLTDKGKQHISRILETRNLQELEGQIRRIKSKYGKYSLNKLLFHVYTKYPEMTTESEIRERVLRRSPRR